MKSWGKECIIDAYDCDIELIKSADNIKAFLLCVVKDIDMIAYGDPVMVHFGSDEKLGWTAIQTIETSNITGHFAEDINMAFINVFSCKDFDSTIVENLVKRFFGSNNIKKTVVVRGIYD